MNGYHNTKPQREEEEEKIINKIICFRAESVSLNDDVITAEKHNNNLRNVSQHYEFFNGPNFVAFLQKTTTFDLIIDLFPASSVIAYKIGFKPTYTFVF